MNRIKKFIAKAQLDGSDLPDIDMTAKHNPAPADKSPRDIPTDSPTYCAFCCATLEKTTPFRAFSKVKPASAICSACIERFALMNKFCGETFDIYFQQQPDYAPLQNKILKRFFAETGSIRLKKAVAGVAIRMLIRGSAVLSGQKGSECPRTGIGLEPIRIAFVGADAEECLTLLRIACSETAMGVMKTDQKDLASGKAFEELIKKTANSETQWADLGILFCSGYAMANAGCSVIFACADAASLPKGIETIRI